MKKILYLVIAAAICGLILYLVLLYFAGISHSNALTIAIAGAVGGLAVELGSVHLGHFIKQKRKP